MIILKGGSHVSEWKFPPNITKCPSRKCASDFTNRIEAIAHYRKKHAMNYQYCSKCKMLIPTHKMKNFNSHYLKVHPSGKDKRIQPVEMKEVRIVFSPNQWNNFLMFWYYQFTEWHRWWRWLDHIDWRWSNYPMAVSETDKTLPG